MKIGILGTGIVGNTLALHLLKNGHEVMVGSRSGISEKAKALLKEYPNALHGTFAAAAKFGDIIFHCIMGIHSLDGARLAGDKNFDGKIVVDLTNPVDFSLGMPPRLTVSNDNSNGEMLQSFLPNAKVVKAFNTVPYGVMVEPSLVNNKNIDMFICGNDSAGKEVVTEMLIKEFGWNRENVIDLGEIIHARSTEALMPFICSIAMRFGTFNNMIKIYRA